MNQLCCCTAPFPQAFLRLDEHTLCICHISLELQLKPPRKHQPSASSVVSWVSNDKSLIVSQVKKVRPKAFRVRSADPLTQNER